MLTQTKHEPRVMINLLVEYPPGGLWIGGCEIYPNDTPDRDCWGEDDCSYSIHICAKHIVLIVWDWSGVTKDG